MQHKNVSFRKKRSSLIIPIVVHNLAITFNCSQMINTFKNKLSLMFDVECFSDLQTFAGC